MPGAVMKRKYNCVCVFVLGEEKKTRVVVFFCFFLLHHMARGILVPRPLTEPGPLAAKSNQIWDIFKLLIHLKIAMMNPLHFNINNIYFGKNNYVSQNEIFWRQNGIV